MTKRIGNLTIATLGVNTAFYYNHTPYRTTLVGFNPRGPWSFGKSFTPGTHAYAFGPFVVGRFDLNWLQTGK